MTLDLMEITIIRITTWRTIRGFAFDRANGTLFTIHFYLSAIAYARVFVKLNYAMSPSL